MVFIQNKSKKKKKLLKHNKRKAHNPKIWISISKGNKQMANKHMKRCATISLENWKLKSRDISTHVLESPKYWGCQILTKIWSKNYCSLLVAMEKQHNLFEREFDNCLQTVHYLMMSNHALCYLLKWLKMYVNTITCAWIYVSTLSIIAPNWMKSRCPSID